MPTETYEHLYSAIMTLASATTPVAFLGWWLKSQFDKVEKATARALVEHEKIDQERHEENLNRFTNISISINNLRRPNGYYADN